VNVSSLTFNTINRIHKMVKVNSIDYMKIIDLGFKSKSEALRAFKGIKSLPKETEDEYLRRVYPMIKDIIFEEKIKDLIKEEEEEAEKIKNDYLNNCKETYVINSRTYIDLDCDHQILLMSHQILQLKYERLVNDHNTLQFMFEYTHSCNRSKIMNLPTKRVNQCYECSICNETILKKESIYDLCHNFHIRCITFWLLDNESCPCCRKVII